MTSEPGDQLDDVRGFLAATGIPWPNGYGAAATIAALDVRFIPTVLVVDRQGLVVWRTGMSGNLDQAIQRALVAP